MQCMRCGKTIFPEEHHMEYGSQIVVTTLKICRECHQSFTDQHHQENVNLNHQPYRADNPQYKQNPHAVFRPTKIWKKRL